MVSGQHYFAYCTLSDTQAVEYNVIILLSDQPLNSEQV